MAGLVGHPVADKDLARGSRESHKTLSERLPGKLLNEVYRSAEPVVPVTLPL